ncbi:hypothetical protein GCM10011587_09830 [Pyruvatibacter mobilis]|nr:hypothetical protein GCM10011587_09830 [Pyruvatibacter mobilis]
MELAGFARFQLSALRQMGLRMGPPVEPEGCGEGEVLGAASDAGEGAFGCPSFRSPRLDPGPTCLGGGARREWFLWGTSFLLCGKWGGEWALRSSRREAERGDVPGVAFYSWPGALGATASLPMKVRTRRILMIMARVARR